MINKLSNYIDTYIQGETSVLAEEFLLESIKETDIMLGYGDINSIVTESVLKSDGFFSRMFNSILRVLLPVPRMRIKLNLEIISDIDVNKLEDKPSKLIYTYDDYLNILYYFSNIYSAIFKLTDIKKDLEEFRSLALGYHSENGGVISGNINRVLQLFSHWNNEELTSDLFISTAFKNENSVVKQSMQQIGNSASNLSRAMSKRDQSEQVAALVGFLFSILFAVVEYRAMVKNPTDPKNREIASRLVSKIGDFYNTIAKQPAGKVTDNTVKGITSIGDEFKKLSMRKVPRNMVSVDEKKEILTNIIKLKTIFNEWSDATKLVAKTHMNKFNYAFQTSNDDNLDVEFLKQVELISICYVEFLHNIKLLETVTENIIKDLRSM